MEFGVAVSNKSIVKKKRQPSEGFLQTFQQPLTKNEEEFYLARLQEDDKEKRNEAKQILIERNLRLVAHIAKKYQGTEVEMEDLISIGTVGLIKAIMSYDKEKKSKLGTYAARCIENAILSQMRLWFQINPPRAKKNQNGVFWHRFPRIFTSFAPLRTAM